MQTDEKAFSIYLIFTIKFAIRSIRSILWQHGILGGLEVPVLKSLLI